MNGPISRRLGQNLHVALLILSLFSWNAWGATEVSVVSTSPDPFNPLIGQITVIDVGATPGVSGLEIRVLSPDSSQVVRSGLILAEVQPGTYSAQWNGKNDQGVLLTAGNYPIRVFNPATSTYLGPSGEVTVEGLHPSIPQVFSPTGTNAAEITVQATPGQTGLSVGFRFGTPPYWWYDSQNRTRLTLAETEPGVYKAQWDAVFGSVNNGGPYLMRDATYTIYVFDEAGNQQATSGQITISGVNQVTVAPSQLSPTNHETIVITAQGVAGLNLEARILGRNPITNQYDQVIRTLPMTGVGTTYTGTWDGLDGFGTAAALGQYRVEVWHTGSAARYYPTATVTVSAGISAVTAAPNPFSPTGTNAAEITVQATPGQTGLSVGFRFGTPPYWWYDSQNRTRLTLAETEPGVYKAQWDAVFGSVNNGGPYLMRDATYTIYVYDEAGNQQATSGQITISGVGTFKSITPNPFTPGGNQFATVSVNAATGMSLELHIVNNATKALTRVLDMTEASGIYTAEWDGKDSFGNYAGANTYRLQVFSKVSSLRYYPESTLSVKVAVFSIAASPDPFVPTGSNAVVLTVLADPGQSGLNARVTSPTGDQSPLLPLKEVGSEGTYEAVWNGKFGDLLAENGIYTIRISDASGNAFPSTGTMVVASAKSLTLSPALFEADGTNTLTITAQVAENLPLEARIGSVRTLPLQETGDGVYSATWDGRDSTGAFVPSGTYPITLWNSATQTRYDIQATLTLKVVDTVPPDTTITSGPIEASYIKTKEATFNWSGSDNLPGALNFAYRLDSGPWSDFGTSTSQTFTALAEGSHTVSVKARDVAGNEDASPASRHFTVDTVPPNPPSALLAQTSTTGVQLSWTHSPSPDVYAYRLYWDNATGTVDYTIPYATVYYPSRSFNASILREGTYRFAVRAVDRAGNEDNNVDVTASAHIEGFKLSVAIESEQYDRGQDVPIKGSVLTAGDMPIVNVPVTLTVQTKGFQRQFQAYTNAAGEFEYRFQPLANEAGTYTVSATVFYNGLEKYGTADFRILGLLAQPQNTVLNVPMNGSRTVEITLSNIGDVPLTGLQYTLADDNPDDEIHASLGGETLATALNPGQTLKIPVQITAPPGSPPSAPGIFTFVAASAEGSKESVLITANLKEAVGQPVATPDPLIAGVHPGETVVKNITITNQGTASVNQLMLSVHDPIAYPWIRLVNSDLGDLDPAQAKDVQIQLSPEAATQLGTYVIQLDMAYDGKVQPVYLTAQVTTASTGNVEFKVFDDTGAIVPGAEVNLVSKNFYVNQTPNGRQEYNDVIKIVSDSDGLALFKNAPTGDYRYVISTPGHDTLNGEIRIEPGTEPQRVKAILVINLVNVAFSVTPTTIQDQYNVSLNITYATDLVKPTLYADPQRVNLSFFPEDTYEGSIIITNTSNHAPVRNLLVNAAALDLVDNEVELVFSNGAKTLTVDELKPGETIQIPFRATIPDGEHAKLNSRLLGNIMVSGEYTFTLDGKAEQSTTSTPIPVLYTKPADLALPTIRYVKDETDGDLCDLEYQGNSYRLVVKSNRNVPFGLKPDIKGLAHLSGGPDAQSIFSENEAFWVGHFNSIDPLTTKGAQTSFDIDGLEETLEQRCTTGNLDTASPHYIGFQGLWEDRQTDNTYLMPISMTVIRPKEVIVSEPCYGCSSWLGGNVPAPLNEHGEVKIQIDQKATLERQAFNVKLDLMPTVAALQNVSLSLDIKDSGGEDASELFFMIVTEQTGLTALNGGSLQGQGGVNWQLVPNSEAGGTAAEGRNYTISASIDYSYGGKSYHYSTKTETVNVKPMPKLVLDYYLPYVVMADKPVKIKVKATNQGFGPANHLALASAQPRIVENENNIPVGFTIDGSSPTPDSSSYQSGQATITFDNVPSGSSAEGYWTLTVTRNGYFVDFTANLKHEDYRGVQLDPLIEGVNTHFVPAIGGVISRSGCNVENLTVEVWQNGQLVASDTVNSAGAYFIPDLAAGDYQLKVKNSQGEMLLEKTVTVVDGQPTAQIDASVDGRSIDSDHDGMSDCWELKWFGDLVQGADDDFDHDGLVNGQEFSHGTNPTNSDTDGDGVSDQLEIQYGRDPLDSSNRVKPPAPSWLAGQVDPNLPTVVLTHGLQPVDDLADAPLKLWTGFKPNGAAKLIYDQLGNRVNIIQYIWTGAFKDKSLACVSIDDYQEARLQTFNAGKVLASRLLEALGPGYSQPVHFIGHSLGTIVNTYAARYFLTDAKLVTEAQFTALDRPDHVSRMCDYIGIGLPWDGSTIDAVWGFNKGFFASVLPMSKFEKLDNYYSNPGPVISAGVGDEAIGFNDNYSLNNPNDVGDKFFTDEAVGGIVDNDHSGVHQWYRWTIAPNSIGDLPYCNGTTFINGPLWMDASLSPCEKGWNYSILNTREPTQRVNNLKFVEQALTYDGDSLAPLGNCDAAVYSQGYTNSALLLVCHEHSSPSISFDAEIPQGFSSIQFDYKFKNIGDGDYLSLSVDGMPIWMIGGSSVVPDQWVNSGAVPIGTAGKHRITLLLHGIGDPNAQIEITNFKVGKLVDAENSNGVPVAVAGANRSIRLGSTVILDGTVSNDPDNAPSPLTYFWTQASGPNVLLTGETTATPNFVSTLEGNYVFSLVVNDGASDSDPSSVTIVVPKLGDIDLDGDIDNNDLNAILAAKNTPASDANDLRDLNGDMKIDLLDSRKLTLLCTRPRCATQ